MLIIKFSVARIHLSSLKNISVKRAMFSAEFLLECEVHFMQSL